MTAIRLAILIVAALAVAQVNEWKPLDQLIAAGIVLLIITYLWSRQSVRSIAMTRRSSDRGQVGNLVSDQITIENRGRLGKLWLEVRDQSSLPGHNSSRVVNVRGRTRTEWGTQSICSRRGRFQFGPVSLRSGDPFGLFSIRMPVLSTVDVLVYPAVVDLPWFALPASTLSGGPVPDRRTQMSTPMVTGIRDYVQGDAYNRISWTATARLSRLMVKEFDIDPTSDVWLILDLDHQYRAYAYDHQETFAGGGDSTAIEKWLDSTEEYAVTVAASIARSCLNQGRGVGMIATGAHYEVIQAENSDRTYIKVLEALSVVSADGYRPLAEVLVAESRRFNRNSSLIVITSSTDPNWIEALTMITSRRVQASVVFIDRSSFDEANDGSNVLERLKNTRVRTYELNYGDLLANVLRST